LRGQVLCGLEASALGRQRGGLVARVQAARLRGQLPAAGVERPEEIVTLQRNVRNRAPGLAQRRIGRQKPPANLKRLLRPPLRKRLPRRVDLIAGAGFEPATFRL